MLAAIPVPDVAADDGISEYTDTDTGVTRVEYPAGEIEGKIQPTKYAKPSGAIPIKTYEIQQNNDGSYKKIWVYEIWLDVDAGIDKGVICNFNSEYNPTNGVLKIPNNVITEFESFVMSDVETVLPNYDKYAVNKVFGIVPIEQEIPNPDYIDEDTTPDVPPTIKIMELPEKHYKLEAGKWIDPNTLLEITPEEKRKLYMALTLNLSGYEAREVITGTDASGNQYEYIPYGDGDYRKKTEYEINAIGDNAFYDSVSGAKANHIQNLELQIVNSVVAIGNEAFRGAATLQKVTIGANVKDIGARAFKECTALNTVDIIDGNKTIGIESFSGCNSLADIRMASTLEKVDMGAFSNCLNLNSADMSASTISGVKVEDFAFYNCPNLNSVQFAPNTDKIGEGCFAVVSAQNSLVEIELPQSSQGLKQLGKHMFDGQRNLKTVTMPRSFGYSMEDDSLVDGEKSRLDSGFFFQCVNLETVIFPEDCVYASFPNDIFVTVENPEFKVVGPATLSMNDPTYARPRTSAHEANVPYQYTEKGVTYLELRVTDKDTGLYDFYRIDENNQLISFDSTQNDIDLVIYDKIGNFPIAGVKDGCFDTVKEKLRSVTVKDNSIQSIDANAFANCPKLTKVSIGNSVSTIGGDCILKLSAIRKNQFCNSDSRL